MTHHTDIKEKTMFYNKAEQQQIERLTNLLSQENLTSSQQRLEKQGLRKGFACLFYGAPGTGKTETVLQIARRTGRDIMQVDIADLRDKYVGESEKNIKEVFERYRAACKVNEVTTILFFNEADAIFSKRTARVQNSVDRMDNAMQNIILQEMENLEGILIATTNLTSNFDKAFERRFLFKVEFHIPDVSVKQQLWSCMLQGISEEEARHLAVNYNFSGGQIENIARQRAIDFVLSGKESSLKDIEEYCKAEIMEKNNNTRPVVGFRQ
jgi:SpoVK/Ycf46/Vps4 family AAA+-type ATPase